MLQIYNSLIRQKELFKPIEANKICIYVCGITVYDYCHIGHARMLVVFDMVVRYLRSIGYQVTYVRNITDIEDKIIQRAQKNGEPFQELTERFIIAMHQDTDALNMLRPDVEPRATDSIAQIITMTEKLINHGLAYAAENGDVYYKVAQFKDYGKLANKKLEDLRAGSRIEIDEAKQDPLDFVLWKAAKPGEPSWPSPWGAGRPGWHIECSAMSWRYLGEHFDIHGGGMDLKFPHHENEIAQSEGAHQHKFVNYWMHNGFVQVDEEKMSKSLGNFFTIRDVMQHYSAEVIRLFILASHYRSPLNYTEDNLENAKASLTRFYTALRDLPVLKTDTEIITEYQSRFNDVMNDDFNTPEALSLLFEIVREINRIRATDLQAARRLATTLRKLGEILGILQGDAEAFLQGSDAETDDEGLSAMQIEGLIDQRNLARQAKNWTEADRIRDLLSDQGVVLEDSAGNTTWRRE